MSSQMHTQTKGLMQGASLAVDQVQGSRYKRGSLMHPHFVKNAAVPAVPMPSAGRPGVQEENGMTTKKAVTTPSYNTVMPHLLRNLPGHIHPQDLVQRLLTSSKQICL